MFSGFGPVALPATPIACSDQAATPTRPAVT